MTHLPDQIRQFVMSQLERYGAARDASLRETLLMRQGAYCGHRFRHDGFEAVWFVEEDQIKLYAPDHSLIATYKPSELQPQSRKAA